MPNTPEGMPERYTTHEEKAAEIKRLAGLLTECSWYLGWKRLDEFRVMMNEKPPEDSIEVARNKLILLRVAIDNTIGALDVVSRRLQSK